MTNDQKKNLRIYEAISYESAVEASTRRSGLTVAEREEARQFVDGMRMRVLAVMRSARCFWRTRARIPSTNRRASSRSASVSPSRRVEASTADSYEIAS
jgi:hypothetical protein